MSLRNSITTLFLIVGLAAVVFAARPTDRPRDRNKLPYKVVCYWGTWAFYRPSYGLFQAEDINPNLCTQINYGFAKLDENNQIALYDPGLDYGDTDWTSGLPWGHGMIRRMTYLRDYNPHLTTVIAIGGWNEGANKYSAMASDPAKRKIFIDSVMDFLDAHNLDGLDLDWEYPSMSALADETRVNGRDADKADFAALLKELREAFEPYGYLLTAAVSAGEPIASRAYDFNALNTYLDSIHLMTYDFHGAWDANTSHNAPLFAKPDATGVDLQFTTDYAVNYFLKQGVSPKKLILGVPLYGRTFQLTNPSSNGYGAPASGGGKAGEVTRIDGMLGYNEICAMNDYTRVFDNDVKAPYKTLGNQWIGYDDPESVGLKIDYAVQKGLGGSLIWSIDTDDFTGRCGSKYPLLKVISGKLNGITGPDTRIPVRHYRPVIRIPTKPIPKKPRYTPIDDPEDHVKHDRRPYVPSAQKFECKAAGLFKDPVDERKFHQCVDVGAGKLTDYTTDCAPGSKFDEQFKVCVHKK